MSSLSHAKHNRKACDYLLKSNIYNDWVITTAFYSALHFCENAMFPLEITNRNGKNEKFKNFDHYCHCNSEYKGKHQIRRKLIEEYLSEVSVEYNRLLDLCWTARYSQYKFDYEMATKARGWLKLLEEAIT